MRILLVFIFYILFKLTLSAQKLPQFFKNINLRVDTNEYNFKGNTNHTKDDIAWAFVYNRPDEVLEIELIPDDKYLSGKFTLIESADYKVIDSIINFNNQLYKFKVQFYNITRSNFLGFRFKWQKDSAETQVSEIKLLPCTKTVISINGYDDEVFVGEEKVFDLISNNVQNIRINNEWVYTPDIDYRVSETNGQLKLYVLAKTLGKRTLTIKLSTLKPWLNNSKPVYELAPITLNLNVKQSRLSFLRIDKQDVTFDDKARFDGIEIQLDNHRVLAMKRTYRIESQEAPGGALIAEIFTRQLLSNDKVLCWLRVYNLHRTNEGYLYLKDNDDSKFITNFNITPKTSIEHISILRNGVDWVESNQAFPGETFNIRLEGVGFDKAHFRFEDIDEFTKDSIISNDKVVEYKIKIPLNISKKKLAIYNHNENTGKLLQIREYQSARPFDYIFINYGELGKKFSGIRGPEFSAKTVKDISMSFSSEKIDGSDRLYGKQYFELGVKITGAKGELIEMQTIKNICICPDASSPRYGYYDTKDCRKEDISLNDYLSRKTYDLDWAKVSLTLSNSKDKYNGEGLEKNIDIIIQKKYKFDVDVSFPSLLTKIGDKAWQNGLGVSMAMIAQFSFYDDNKIGRLKPYKIGAGFLALNAFNFGSNNISRDLGLVVLGSLYPTRRETKFTLPLYLGGGYLLNDGEWFWVFGPGIGVTF